MKNFIKPFALAAGVFAMISLTDVPGALFGNSCVREAEAVVVVRHGAPVAAAVVVTTAVVVASSSAQKNAAAQANANANASATQANQAATQANQAAAQANQAAAQANQAAAQATKSASAPAQQPQPSPPAVGTIVTTLPAGCTQTKLNKIDYMRCDSTYYKPMMVGDKVVFVVEQP